MSLLFFKLYRTMQLYCWESEISAFRRCLYREGKELSAILFLRDVDTGHTALYECIR